MSTNTFTELGISKAVTTALAKRNITVPFAIQNQVIGDALEGHDILAQSPTGSGKTLAFGVPMVDRIETGDRAPAGLILAPTRELACQIVDEVHDIAHARALSIAVVHGGVGIQKQARLAGKAKIVVATPGRLEDLIKRGKVKLDRVRILVIDECDRMLDMGFKPAIDRIVALTPDNRQTLFFSATLDGEAGKKAKAYTKNARRYVYAPKSQKAKVDHSFIKVTHEMKVQALVTQLNVKESTRTLVFVRTKRGVDRLMKQLKSHKVDAVAMHGNKTQRERTRALAHFEKGSIDTLIATDVAARGIDVNDISHVINFDAPDTLDAYVHRVGRTGRAGRSGAGISLILDSEKYAMRRIANKLGLGEEFTQGCGNSDGGGGGGGRSRKRFAGSHRKNSNGSRHKQRNRSSTTKNGKHQFSKKSKVKS